MARNMNNIEQETIARSFRIVNEKVQLLIKVWKTCFEDICYLDYMASLPDSIGMFLDEIFHITMGYCEQKNKEIQELFVEAIQLQRVLGVAVPREDWVYPPMSLDRKCMMLQQKVSTLRSKVKRQFDQYVEEQTKLCKELGKAEENYKRLYTVNGKDVLPDEQKMALFARYLEGLRQEKAERVARIAQLQADVRTLAKQLDWEPRKPEHKSLMHDTLPPKEELIDDLEGFYSVLYKLLKGKLLLGTQTQQTELAPVPDNLSPPPPPPSPEAELTIAAEVALSQQLTREHQQSLLQLVDSPRQAGLLEVNIRRYQQLLADSCSDISRERIIEDIFRGIHGNINLWWDRCLISLDDRKRSKVEQFTELNEESMVAHVEQQDQLKAYYYENESLFQHVYKWSEWWSAYLKFESNGGGGAKAKKKANPSEKGQRRQVKEQLAAVEVRLKELCDEYEQRTKSEFTINGEPAMSLLSTLKGKRKELTIPSSCKVRPPRVINRKSLRIGPSNQMYSVAVLPKHTVQCMAGSSATAMVAENPPPTCHTIERHLSAHATTMDGPDAMNRSSNSSSDGEANDKRDDELLEEAFASASASTAIKKRRIGSENGARPKAAEGRSALSNVNNEPSGIPAQGGSQKTTGPPLSTATVIKETPKNRVQTAGTTIKRNAPSTAGDGSNVSSSTASLDCAGTNKVRTKSKQSVKREPSLII
uniref:Protein regulator of cytokinesis 1 n=1 Tax=Anopheles atroparvus TaxID=41427 RepID=A0AAG5DP85_ANOAO